MASTLRLALLLCALPTFAEGGGLATGVLDDPCATPPLSFPAFAATVAPGDDAPGLHRMYLALRLAACGDAPVPPASEALLLRWFASGHHVPLPDPAPVPLPGSMLLLLTALWLSRQLMLK